MKMPYHYIYECIPANARIKRSHDFGLILFYRACNGGKGYVRRKKCTCNGSFHRAA